MALHGPKICAQRTRRNRLRVFCRCAFLHGLSPRVLSHLDGSSLAPATGLRPRLRLTSPFSQPYDGKLARHHISLPLAESQHYPTYAILVRPRPRLLAFPCRTEHARAPQARLKWPALSCCSGHAQRWLCLPLAHPLQRALRAPNPY